MAGSEVRRIYGGMKKQVEPYPDAAGPREHDGRVSTIHSNGR